jgi:hypothetical protein
MISNHVLAAALAAFSCAASAQSLKPGLWEINQKMDMAGAQDPRMAQMQQQMANMPPEQRKMMEAAMAQQGVKMGPAGPGGGMIIQMCMTKEMAERNDVPAQRGDCKTTQQSRTGNTMKMAFTCSNPPSSGEGQVTFASAEAYTMKMVITTQAQGKPEKMNMDASGKWLKSDCGSVKPMLPGK